MRIGQGYDVHAFGEGDHITLGGVTIPYEHGLVAHSDGDVLIHALCDAFLGAAALGDIGRHFPDTDPRYRGVDSRELLREVVSLVGRKGYSLSNADMTIVAQAPKMSPYLEQITLNLATDCGCNVDQINIKATTTEKLGFEGRGEGIACQAVILLSQVN
ncbi:MAG: 2-C-methyl-D-erythritol 2,4-cyclodiphosphate synthase [Porticoccus sp.]|nr:2-C-methyl-D-erythritol 2,4-cyclodiphosphate synthase [Porticoccus sp.]MBQ0807380.1 2-C-methyl-D-erythritol 2,4-cyclodiphosphate synthase [Porticoccus sp.]